MEIPEDFPYREVLLRGRPEHGDDGFLLEHPRMERERRAKLFAPFDALDGYGDALRTKNAVYVDKIRLSPDQQAALDRDLGRLCALYGQRGRLREGGGGLPWVRITRYVVCSDRYHDACGLRGTYVTAEGRLTGADPEVSRTLRVEGEVIPIGDVVRIRILEHGPRGKRPPR